MFTLKRQTMFTMKRQTTFCTALALMCALLSPQGLRAQTAEPFEVWLKKLEQEAKGKGFDAATVERALAGVTPIERVIELDRKQPEFTLTFGGYMNRVISDKRIERGRDLLVKHKDLLARVTAKHAVQPRFLVAFWGLETNFGDYFGAFPVAGALATLAHDGRRSAFFREQLLAALDLMSRGDMPVDVKGSWAGAMGNFQFIPTTYRDFAVDFDGDNVRDLWFNLEDAFASAANYLSRSGWNDERTWGREVHLPDGFDVSLTGLKQRRKLAEWQALGVRRADGKRDLPDVDIEGAVLLPAGLTGPAFMVYDNFETILRWNRSIFYAIAVGHLADRLAGGGPFLKAPPADDVPMSRQDVIEMQTLLGQRGFDAGEPDGVIGAKTRSAVRAYQRAKGLPADGYPSALILKHLKGSG
ncbi:MAG: lytic murein transglycosylase [Rhodospirillales bacterium]